MKIQRVLINFVSRHFYNLPFKKIGTKRYFLRSLSRAPGICDICDVKVGFSDYGYMCRKHGDIFYQSNWKYFPKFLYRMYCHFVGE